MAGVTERALRDNGKRAAVDWQPAHRRQPVHRTPPPGRRATELWARLVAAGFAGGPTRWEDQQMAEGARLGCVVIFVHDLDRSVAFYADVLALEVADRSPTAALLSSAGGASLVLRAMGGAASHPLGSVGVQYVVWTVAGAEDLARCERALAGRGAHRDTRSSDGVALVEGRDPDDMVVMISHPGPGALPLRKLPARIYGW
jgi:catechol 2,3-dioxygenase-like lactoylglutathione lyase family enzyme